MAGTADMLSEELVMTINGTDVVDLREGTDALLEWVFVTSPGGRTLIDLYALVGVERASDEDTIARAWHLQSALCHPDRLSGTDEATKRRANRLRQALEGARRILCSPARAAYDVLLEGWTGTISDGPDLEPAPPTGRLSAYVDLVGDRSERTLDLSM